MSEAFPYNQYLSFSTFHRETTADVLRRALDVAAVECTFLNTLVTEKQLQLAVQRMRWLFC